MRERLRKSLTSQSGNPSGLVEDFSEIAWQEAMSTMPNTLLGNHPSGE